MNHSNWQHIHQKKRGKYFSYFGGIIFDIVLTLFFIVSCAPTTNITPTVEPEPTSAASAILITLHYNERPPYLVTTNQGVEGLTGDPATIAFEESKFPFKWEQTPSKRQLYILQQNSGRDCLVGWFKIAERENYARYTLPIYQDKPQIALARSDNDKINSGGNVRDILSNPNLNLLVKDGYSYGDFLDEIIRESNPNLTETTVENNAMLKMIHARHADYFFIAPEEANGLIETSEYNLEDFKFVIFQDIPDGEKRYILCSMNVENDIIEQLNAIIHQSMIAIPEE